MQRNASAGTKDGGKRLDGIKREVGGRDDLHVPQTSSTHNPHVQLVFVVGKWARRPLELGPAPAVIVAMLVVLRTTTKSFTYFFSSVYDQSSLRSATYIFNKKITNMTQVSKQNLYHEVHDYNYS